MNTQQANRRYFRVLIPAMVIFLGASFGLGRLEETGAVSNTILIVLAIVPIAALLSMFWLHWRFLNDIDEYLRQIQVKALLFGTAVVMTLATGWGYLENLADVPAMPVYLLNPIFWLAYAIAVGVLTRRAGAA